MSTKNNPTEFNCYDKAEPDEPMFVLLGRDPVASFVVQFWIDLRLRLKENLFNEEQIMDAEACAENMRCWAEKLGKTERVEKAQEMDEGWEWK